MLANIIPLRRMPRSMESFTYLVPAELEKKICIGHLVTIPFRNTPVFGVVLSLAKTSEIPGKTKSISSLIGGVPLVQEWFLSFIQAVSSVYGVSAGAVLDMGVPLFSKKALGGLEFTTVPRVSKKKYKETFLHYKNTEEHKQFVLSKISSTGQTLILVPEKKYIDEVAGFFETKDSVVFQSDLSVTAKRKAWVSIRNGEKSIIIGTRGAVMLPFHNLQSVIIDYEHHEEHKHWDQAPRFYDKDVVILMQKFLSFELTTMSFSPSVGTYYSIFKKNLLAPNFSSPLQLTDKEVPKLINMKDERKGGNFSSLGEKSKEAIFAAPGDVFVFVNRKGFASSIRCRECGHEEKCPTCGLPFVYHDKEHELQCHYCKTKQPMFLVCPKCGSSQVKFSGGGVEMMENTIQQIAQHKNGHEIVILDSEHAIPVFETDKSYIVIGTELAFKALRWDRIDLIVLVDIDRQASLPEFNALERLWHLIHEIQYYRKTQSEFFIQTFEPKQLLFRSLSEPDRFYRTDLNARQGLQYPPYSFLVRYFYGENNSLLAKNEVERVWREMNMGLTKEAKKIILTSPIEMHPRFFRGKHWYAIIAKVEAKNWASEVQWLNGFIPEGWKVDPGPISLLQP